MTNAEKEKKIIELNDKRREIIKYLKQKVEKGYHDKMMKKLEEINKEIEELIYG